MATSRYYNSRGDDVRRYQQYLNGLGASLKVDGIWGKKTEAAYDRYRDEFDRWLGARGGGFDSGGVDSDSLAALLSAFRLPSYQEQTEAQLRQAASAQYAPRYNAEAEALRAQNARNQQALAQRQTALDAEQAQQAAATRAQYEQNAAALQRMLTARGMGRSTYAGDVAQRQSENLLGALDALSARYAADRADLRQQSQQYDDAANAALARLMNDRRDSEEAYYQKLLAQQQTARSQADSAYNSIVQALMQLLSTDDYRRQQLAQQASQFAENLKLGYRKLR